MRTLDVGERDKAIRLFASEIGAQQIGLAYHRPQEGLRSLQCVSNVVEYTKSVGGAVRLGWYFVAKLSEEFGFYLVATHHAVWHDPKTEALVDITPFHKDRSHHPVTFEGDVIFAVDDNAKPYMSGNRIVPLPLKFYPIQFNDGLKEYTQILQQDELLAYDKQHGSKFSSDQK